MLACVMRKVSVYQGVEGPRGPPGGRGVQGEGLPGPKVGFGEETYFEKRTRVTKGTLILF